MNSFEERIAAQIPQATREPFKIIYNAFYVPDFMLPNGTFIEAKGRFTVEDRRKHLRVQERNPNLDIRFVFQKDNRIVKGSKTRYSDWCIKHNFKYSIGEVPKEWID